MAGPWCLPVQHLFSLLVLTAPYSSLGQQPLACHLLKGDSIQDDRIGISLLGIWIFRMWWLEPSHSNLPENGFWQSSCCLGPCRLKAWLFSFSLNFCESPKIRQAYSISPHVSQYYFSWQLKHPTGEDGICWEHTTFWFTIYRALFSISI